MAERVEAVLLGDQMLSPLRERGYRISVCCAHSCVVALATHGSETTDLAARVSVPEWWDSKELSPEDWAQRLAHTLAVALRAQEKRARLPAGSGGEARMRYALDQVRAAPLRLRIRPITSGSGTPRSTAAQTARR